MLNAQGYEGVWESIFCHDSQHLEGTLFVTWRGQETHQKAAPLYPFILQVTGPILWVHFICEWWIRFRSRTGGYKMEAWVGFLIGSKSSLQISHKQIDDRLKRNYLEVIFGGNDCCGSPLSSAVFVGCRWVSLTFAMPNKDAAVSHKQVKIISQLLNMTC